MKETSAYDTPSQKPLLLRFYIRILFLAEFLMFVKQWWRFSLSSLHLLLNKLLQEHTVSPAYKSKHAAKAQHINKRRRGSAAFGVWPHDGWLSVVITHMRTSYREKLRELTGSGLYKKMRRAYGDGEFVQDLQAPPPPAPRSFPVYSSFPSCFLWSNLITANMLVMKLSWRGHVVHSRLYHVSC